MNNIETARNSFNQILMKNVSKAMSDEYSTFRIGKVLSTNTLDKCSIAISGSGQRIENVFTPSNITVEAGDTVLILTVLKPLGHYVLNVYSSRGAKGASTNLSCGFHAYLSSAQSISDASSTKVALDAITFDIAGDFSTANNRFIAPVNGYYFFSGCVRYSGLADGERYIAYLFKNGADLFRGIDTKIGGAAGASATVSGLAKLATNDYIELYTYYDGASATEALTNNDTQTYLTGHLVGTY